MTQDMLSRIWWSTEVPDLSGDQWELLLAQARRARLAGRLANLFEVRGWYASAPAGARDFLQGMSRVMRTRSSQLVWELDCLRRALAGATMPVVLLKGAAYVAAKLPPSHGRMFSDIDLLVPSQQVSEAESLLLAGGWVSQQLDAYDDRYYRQWMHELPPLVHVERGTTIDLHHMISPPTSRWPVDGSTLLARARPVDGESPFLILCPEDMILHSVLHLLQNGEFSSGLRDLLDVHDLLLHFGAEDHGFHDRLVARAIELGLATPLAHAVRQLERLSGVGLSKEASRRLAASRPPSMPAELMAWMLERALRPEHPSCDLPGTGIARLGLFIRSHWLRMPWYQILPHLARKSWIRARAQARKAAGERSDGKRTGLADANP